MPDDDCKEIVGCETTLWSGADERVASHHRTHYAIGTAPNGAPLSPSRTYWTYVQTPHDDYVFSVEWQPRSISFNFDSLFKGHFSIMHGYLFYNIYIARELDLRKDNDYHVVPLNGMPADRILQVRQELAKLLRRFQVSEPAIKHFIAQSAAHLRLALKTRRGNLPLADAPDSRWPEDRLPGENPIGFVERNYGDLIKYGYFNQSHLSKIDKKALNALRNYCANRNARPRRPLASQVLPSSKVDPDTVLTASGKLTYRNSVAAWRSNPSPANLARKRAYAALQTRKSRARHSEPG